MLNGNTWRWTRPKRRPCHKLVDTILETRQETLRLMRPRNKRVYALTCICVPDDQNRALESAERL